MGLSPKVVTFQTPRHFAWKNMIVVERAYHYIIYKLKLTPE